MQNLQRCFYSTEASVFEEMAKSLDSLLVFQTDRPMAPFIVEILGSLLHFFYARFVRKGVLLEATTVWELVRIDLHSQNSLVSVEQ